MILTDYYKMQVLKVMKSHRFDRTASTGEYPLFEEIAKRARNGRFSCYYNGVPDTDKPYSSWSFTAVGFEMLLRIL